MLSVEEIRYMGDYCQYSHLFRKNICETKYSEERERERESKRRTSISRIERHGFKALMFR